MSEEPKTEEQAPKPKAEETNVIAMVWSYTKPSIAAVVLCVVIMGMVNDATTRINNAYARLSQKIAAVEEKVDLVDRKVELFNTHLDEGLVLFQREVDTIGTDMETLKKEIQDIKLDAIYKTN